MANNKNTTNIESTILENKIVQLSTKLSVLNQSQDGHTQEQLMDEATKFLSTFFAKLSEPIFSPVDVLTDHKPDVEVYNKNLTDILSDLTIIFSEFENIESVLISHFNFIVTDSNKILSGLKQVYSKLGDYILFSKDPTGDSFYFSDSFNNLNRIDFNSSLLNATQCNIDQVQGIATLPVSNKTIITVTEIPVINSNSNGTPGNSLEDTTGASADINNINDDNPDTWFEYERVLVVDDGIPLTLDITINLSNPQIINFIRINPNNFGTKNQILIDTIETSVDGKSYLSVKDDIPLNGFTTQDENNVFLLAPSTSKFAGQGLYTFNPRKVKYVHLIFKQFTPYTITTDDTVNLRYAIGIRDIEIVSLTFDVTGEIISANYQADAVFKKIALITNQNPTTFSDLVSIDHFVSADNGSTWNQVEPEDFIGKDNTIPKIINFNTLDKDSINTQTPIQSLRYKATMKRNKDAFVQGVTENKNSVDSIIELHQIPAQTPFEIALNSKPISDTISVLDPSFGSRGIDTNRFTIGVGTGTRIEFFLPFTNIRNDLIKSFQGNQYFLTEYKPEQIRVNGELWTRGFLNIATANDTVYEFDNLTGKIKFGDNIHGRAVPIGAPIDIKFTPERLFISSQQLHSGSLVFPTSRDKKTLIIKQFLASSLFAEVLKKNTNIHKLNNKNIINVVSFSDKITFSLQRSFINGSTELISDGDWSIDSDNGIVYSLTHTSTSNDSSITYTHIPETILEETDWDFDTSGSIVINNNVFTTIPVSNESILVGVKYIAFANVSILQGSVKFTDNFVFKKEVPYIDGRIELTNNIKTNEAVSALTSFGNLKYFDLRMSVVNDISYDVVFSNKNIFTTRVSNLSDANSMNKYFIDLPNRRVYVYSPDVISDPGSVSYYYQNQSKRIDGLYSINYSTGEVFTALPTGTGATVAYQYSNYVVQYPIAREIDSNDFSMDETTNTITISEREILSRINLNSTSGSTKSSFYQITFDTFSNSSVDITELEPFFTPILKDYAIKIIPESALLF